MWHTPGEPCRLHPQGLLSALKGSLSGLAPKTLESAFPVFSTLGPCKPNTEASSPWRCLSVGGRDRKQAKRVGPFFFVTDFLFHEGSGCCPDCNYMSFFSALVWSQVQTGAPYSSHKHTIHRASDFNNSLPLPPLPTAIILPSMQNILCAYLIALQACVFRSHEL